mmetsp:Transcript_46033/g.127863  ORF Transcript_46033/g.127863 Transcript_46033/m.127863 type:complete len:424 (+) Transcript_46033:12-1283(+)
MVLGFYFTIASCLATCAPGILESAPRNSEYWIDGHASRLEDIACGWPASPKSCAVSPRQVELRPGAVVVVDDFLNDTDFTLLRRIVAEGIVKAEPGYTKEEEHALNVSFSSVIRLPSDVMEASMEALVRRIHGNAIRTIRSVSDFKEGPWAYRGAYYPDYWTVRRYHRKNGGGAQKLDVHTDTGSYARCLSAVLFLGEQHDTLKGGAFRTRRCKTGDCGQYGWQYDQSLPVIHEPLLQDSNLVTLAEVPYKSGRLVFFLAETLHDVTEVVEGNRDVLFVWFGCEPCLMNSVMHNGHFGLVEFLVAHDADVTRVPPSTGQGPIHHAAVAGHALLTKYLIEQEPSVVHMRQANSELPLHGAAAMGHVEVVKVLASHRADTMAQDSAGLSAIDYAWKYAPHGQDSAVVEHLKKFGAGKSQGESTEL